MLLLNQIDYENKKRNRARFLNLIIFINLILFMYLYYHEFKILSKNISVRFIGHIKTLYHNNFDRF